MSIPTKYKYILTKIWLPNIKRFLTRVLEDYFATIELPLVAYQKSNKSKLKNYSI